MNKKRLLRNLYYLPRVLLIVMCMSLASITMIFFGPSNVFAQDGGLSSLADDDNFDIDEDWDDQINSGPVVNDPFEGYNRWMYNFNDKVYTHVFNPLAKGYDFLVPNKVQGSINNFVRFSQTPKRFFNNLLQQKYKEAFIEVERLVINATLGIAGFFDPAKAWIHLEQSSEDFGQTLGSYGAGSGPYIVWPLIGPSTGRDSIGTAIDIAFDPLFWFAIYDVDSQTAFNVVRGTKRINNYSYNVQDTYERITDSAIDPYVALQYAYIQYRNKSVDK